MKEFFGRFTMDVIATTAFGVQSDSFKYRDAEFVKMIAKFSDITLPNRILIFMVILLTPWLAKFLPLSFFNMTSINFLGEVVKAAKNQRQDNTDKLVLLVKLSSQINTIKYRILNVCSCSNSCIFYASKFSIFICTLIINLIIM